LHFDIPSGEGFALQKRRPELDEIPVVASRIDQMVDKPPGTPAMESRCSFGHSVKDYVLAANHL
jgi:hypothetical protein